MFAGYLNGNEHADERFEAYSTDDIYNARRSAGAEDLGVVLLAHRDFVTAAIAMRKLGANPTVDAAVDEIDLDAIMDKVYRDIKELDDCLDIEDVYPGAERLKAEVWALICEYWRVK